MKSILARRHAPVLRRYARSTVLLAFDFDGTLAPIVSDRACAAMRLSTRALLTRVAARYPAIVVSGRARADVRRRLRGVPLLQVIGNHGIEPWRVLRSWRPAVRHWTTALSRPLSRLPGVDIEDKTYSLAVHYRRSRTKRLTRAVIERAVSSLDGVRAVPGKDVVNVLPEDAPHKGMALTLALARFACDTAVYVGDDDTDEDVFACNRENRWLTIRIGRRAESKADYFLPNQSDIDRFLRALLECRHD